MNAPGPELQEEKLRCYVVSLPPCTKSRIAPVSHLSHLSHFHHFFFQIRHFFRRNGDSPNSRRQFLSVN